MEIDLETPLWEGQWEQRLKARQCAGAINPLVLRRGSKYMQSSFTFSLCLKLKETPRRVELPAQRPPQKTIATS